LGYSSETVMRLRSAICDIDIDIDCGHDFVVVPTDACRHRRHLDEARA
jgi:hypothetical protein